MQSNDSRESKGDVLAKRLFMADDTPNISTEVIQAIGELLGIDPTDEKLHIDECIDLAALDSMYCSAHRNDHNLHLDFEYGGYTVEVTSFGKVLVHGDKVAHENGEVRLPTSMSWSMQTHTDKENTRSETRKRKFLN